MKSLKYILLTFLLSNSVMANKVGTALYAIKTDLLPNILAKELCSCVFVTGANQRLGHHKALKICMERANLPVPESVMKKLLSVSVVENDQVIVDPSTLSEVLSLGRVDKGVAVYDKNNPQYGCLLKFKK